MKRYFAFVSLLALHLVLGAFGDEDIIDVDLDSRIYLEAPEPSNTNLVQCLIETSEKKKYEVYPKNVSPGLYIGQDKYCGLDIRDTKIGHAGVWIMTTITNDAKSFTTEFKVRITQDVPIRPSRYVSARSGQWISVWIEDDVDDVVLCNVDTPKDSNRDGQTYDMTRENVPGLQRYRGCGVRIFINDTLNGVKLNDQDGQWKISAHIGDYKINQAIFQINVPYPTNNDEVIVLRWDIGSEQTIDISKSDVSFCKFTRPDGVQVKSESNYCRLKINSVNELHNGIWYATYALRDQVEVKQVKVIVKTWDKNVIEGISFPGNGQEINLLCKTGETDLNFCSFIRPDQQLINAPAGVGNDKYSYYGQGYRDTYSPKRNYGECGLTIHKPSNVDFGSWVCEVGISKNSKTVIRGTVINVDKNRGSGIDVKINNPQVTVKRGDEFKIRCSANAVLNYCWLTSPNGTKYSVMPNGEFGSNLKYDGKGFAMGECGAIIKNANNTDNGEWTCHLGIVDLAEVAEKVSVKVTDTYLIAVEETVYASTTPKMTCRTFRNEEGTIQYCRWVRPDGNGINIQDSHRYEISKGLDQCSLSILYFEPEDIGQWSCHVSLTKATNQEEWATVNLVSSTTDTTITSLVSIILGSALLVLTLVGAGLAGLYLYKRKTARVIKYPPPYYHQEYPMPNGAQGGHDVTLKKDLNELKC